MSRFRQIIISGVFLIALVTSMAVPTQSEILPTLRFDENKLAIDLEAGASIYEESEPIVVAENLTLGAFSFLIEREIETSGARLTYEALSEIRLSDQIELVSGQPTSSDSRYLNLGQIIPRSEQPGFAPVHIAGEITINQIRYIQVVIFPLYVDSEDGLTFVNELAITLEGERLNEASLISESQANESGSYLAPPLTGAEIDYVIVTASPLTQALRNLADYKNATGIKTELVDIEQILPLYSGRDDAERLREFLKEFYSEGGRYVLLGGDETLIPIRYAYHYRTSTTVDIDYLQVSDLYFADVNGDWNADGDDVWGERYDDDADLTPELMVGRLPLHDSIEAVNYVAKLIAYETDPGRGDYSWLTRSYFYSSDQMRDYDSVGQHNLIGQAFPVWFELDTISGVESSSGIDLGPTNDLPLETTRRLSDGFGIVNIIAHGRGDGFVVKSSGYNNWPKAYLLTAEQNGGHGSIDSLSQNGLAGFYYSLACDNGGFDLEQAYSYSSPALSRSLLGMADAGAVGFIANSRWGWVSSSYLLQKAFFDSVFAHPDRVAIMAFNEVKKQFYYFRDLALGQNYYGDPTLKIHTSEPSPLDISLIKSGSTVTALVSSEGSGAANTLVRVSQSGVILGEYLSDDQGKVVLEALIDLEAEYIITAIIPGHVNGLAYYAPSIVSTVDEPESPLPQDFSLGQNYPNPFNPETTIPLDLPAPAHINLSILNILGQRVASLCDQQLTPGSYSFRWDGRNESGESVASGTYFYRLKVDARAEVRKMVLLR